METVQAFIDSWTEDPLNTKPIFESLLNDLAAKEKAVIEFHQRPGISHSLRGLFDDRQDRPLFVMIDVIDDDPKARWLSVCFYGDMIDDPDEMGDLIPGGLLGADGYCFDISEADGPLTQYVRQRIQQAYAHGANQAK
jgi:hypothetical protein